MKQGYTLDNTWMQARERLVEEGDIATDLPDPRFGGADLYAKGRSAVRQVFRSAGFDGTYGRRLYGDVCAAGLVDVDAVGKVQMLRAQSSCARFWQLTIAQLRDRIVGAGLLTNEEMDQFLALHDDAGFVAMGSVLMAVWGRRPGSARGTGTRGGVRRG